MKKKAVSKLMVNWMASFVSVILLLSMMALPALAVLAANTVNSAAIINGQVRTPDLADGAVTSAKIKNGQVKRADLRLGSVASGRIADNAVTTAKIRNGHVRSADIAIGAVLSGRIANNAITSAKIRNGQIKNIDIAPSAAISDSKISYDTTKTGYLSISPSTMNPYQSSYNFARGPTKLTMNTGGGYFYAPVNLPHGAIITKLRYYAFDNVAASTFAQLYRQHNTGGGAVQLATSGTSINSGVKQALVDSTIGIQIDNDNFTYAVEVYLSGTGVDALNTIIEYAYSSPGS